MALINSKQALTAAPTVGIGGGNTAGTSVSFARADHGHKLRETGGPADLTIGAVADGQFLKRVGTAIVGAAGTGGSGSGLATKAGAVLAATFSGSPKTAAVTFATPFASASYSVALTPEISDRASFGLAVGSVSAAGFTINLGSNSTHHLIAIHWTAVLRGET
jgi:hypothetical protein